MTCTIKTKYRLGCYFQTSPLSHRKVTAHFSPPNKKGPRRTTSLGGQSLLPHPLPYQLPLTNHHSPPLRRLQISLDLIIRDAQAVLIPFLPLGAGEGFAGHIAQGFSEQGVLLELGQGFGQGS